MILTFTDLQYCKANLDELIAHVDRSPVRTEFFVLWTSLYLTSKGCRYDDIPCCCGMLDLD